MVDKPGPSESNGNSNENNDPKREVAKLIIILHADTTIRVEGPISDKLLSYGLIETARDAIFEHGLKVKQVVPNKHE